ncbi:MAG: restriction endonuclease subunit S, partial [Ignavibacteriaceae bacterium]
DAAVPGLNRNLVHKLSAIIPEPKTQQRIASILSAYDDLIEVNNQRIKLLEQTARELYKEWFVRMRFPGYKQAKFKKGVPEGWTTIAISDVVDFKMGQSPKSEFYNEEGIGLPFHQGVGNYGLRFPVHKVFCSVNGRTANEGDVLFSVRAPVGRLNIADRKLIIGRGLAALRHKKGLNSYLFYLLQNEFSKEDLIGNGSIFNSVGKDELRKFKIFDVGDLALNFNNLVKPIDEQLLILIQQNTQLRQIRDRLLPRLVSGKLQLSEL